jgi:hypothetical protein
MGALAALGGSTAGNAMAYPIELAGLFDVDVDQLSGMLALNDAISLNRMI